MLTQQVQYGEFIKPEGWILIRLRPDSEASGPPIPAHHVRIVIVANHLNGKDTHVRGVKVFGPPESVPCRDLRLISRAVKPAHDNLDEEDEHDKKPDGRALLELGHDGLSGFTSLKFKMHETIR